MRENAKKTKKTLHRNELRAMLGHGAKIKGVFSFLLLLCSMALMTPRTSSAANLVIADKGISSYQIVIPDKAVDEVVDRWLMATAKLMQTAFHKNGFEISVLRESAMAADKPSIYLGATKFAAKNGIEVKTDDWSYVWKTVGRDLVIVGSDRKDPDHWSSSRGHKIQLALLGSVKGALDFMREYAGARFLFNNNVDMRNPEVFGKGEDLPFDTRSIAFVPVRHITVSSDLDLRKTPPLKSRSTGSNNLENFYMIANNYFPAMSSTSTLLSSVRWSKVISVAKYGETHPEYFALLPNGKRAGERTIDYNPVNYVGETALDVTDPDVLNLMFLAAEEQIKKGVKILIISPLDGYLLDRCNCDRCNAFFGLPATTYEESMVRGASGKLWQIYFSIAERIQKKYPDVKIVVWDYQDTPLHSNSVQQFPTNVMPQFQFGTPQIFDNLKGVDIPAGIVGLEETFTAFGVGGPYAPEHTPEYAALVAQAMVRHKVQWTARDGSLKVWGLQSPVYYVYGRMLDDATADYKDIEKEFYTAAFGEVTPQMTGFFDLLHKQIDLYSDFFGLYQPAWTTSAIGRYGRYRDNKWHHQSIYTVEFVDKANALLATAEQKAKDPDVKARLYLIRLEFDYLSNLGKILYLQDAWTIHPSPESLKVLLDAVDAWHAQIKTLSEGISNSRMQLLKEWPEMRPFNGDTYHDVALQHSFYQNGNWQRTAIGWDTAAVRAGALTASTAQVNSATAIPDITSAVWDHVPTGILRSGIPRNVSRTTLKTLHDQNNLYVRVDSRINVGSSARSATKVLEDLVQPKSESDVFQQEYVEISIQPKAGGTTYRFAVNPLAGLRYDAVMKPKEDTSWNGGWKFIYQINSVKDDDSQGYPNWTAWFQIPFSDLEIAAPAKGEVWKLNVTRRGMQGEGVLGWRGEAHISP
ncbi:MAG: DUF4838 domain-containing protein [Kiritimatiellia bacterium]